MLPEEEIFQNWKPSADGAAGMLLVKNPTSKSMQVIFIVRQNVLIFDLINFSFTESIALKSRLWLEGEPLFATVGILETT